MNGSRRYIKIVYLIKKNTNRKDMTKNPTSAHVLRLDFFSNTILNLSMVPDIIPLDMSMPLPI
uniref:Uncharacterized protein n=1 Tax=Rhizophora mucronata TaxID=61149 RepID=A0A2P2IZM4_RHIMU